MPELKEKTPSSPAEAHRPDLRGRYRALAIPAVVAACMAQKVKHSEKAAARPDAARGPAERD